MAIGISSSGGGCCGLALNRQQPSQIGDTSTRPLPAPPLPWASNRADMAVSLSRVWASDRGSIIPHRGCRRTSFLSTPALAFLSVSSPPQELVRGFPALRESSERGREWPGRCQPGCPNRRRTLPPGSVLKRHAGPPERAFAGPEPQEEDLPRGELDRPRTGSLAGRSAHINQEPADPVWPWGKFGENIARVSPIRVQYHSDGGF